MSKRDGSAENPDPLPMRWRRWWRRSFLFLRRLLRRAKPEPSLRSSLEEIIGELEEVEQESFQEQPELSFSKQERALLANILKLREKSADQVMVKRANVVAVEIDTPLPEAVEQILESKHSRVPVYQGSIDHVLGVINIKDVVVEVNRNRSCGLADLARPPRVVSPSLPVLELLFEMRQTRQHMALVVDEFGGIDGLVTIEDLIEEIVGEIEDEYDEQSAPSIVEQTNGDLIVDAKLPARDLETHLRSSLLSGRDGEASETVGSVVLSLAGHIPSRGELIRSSGIEFEVMEADSRRIKTLKVRDLRSNKRQATVDHHRNDT